MDNDLPAAQSDGSAAPPRRLLLAYFAEHSLDDVMATLKGIRRARPHWELEFLGSRRAVEFADSYIARWELGGLRCHVAPLAHLPWIGGHAVGTYLLPGFRLPEGHRDFVLAYMQPFVPHAGQLARRLRALLPRPQAAFIGVQNIRLNLPAPVRWMAAEALRIADWVAAVGPEQRDVLRLAGYRGPVEYGIHGYDADLFHPGVAPEPEVRARLGGGPVIAYLGRLEASKGTATLVSAFGMLHRLRSDVRLLIVGDGPEAQAVRDQLAAMGLEGAAWFAGRVSYDRMPGFMRAADVTVVPSEIRGQSYLCPWLRQPWREQFGRVVVEAMACGMPVVGSDSGEIPRVLGREDVVFQSERPEALARCLEGLLGDGARRRELGEYNAQRALRWSLDRIAEGLCRRFEEGKGQPADAVRA